MDSVKRKSVLIPPDGGWGWMVVFGCAVTNSFNQALLSVFGLIFGDKLNEMSQGTFGAALVANMMLLVTSFSGLFVGPCLKKFSPRKVSMAGSILAGFGMIAASFSTEVWHLIVTYSLFTGFGVGILQPSTFIAVNSYFKAKKGVAIGISMAGTGIGQILMPHLVRYLLEKYGFQGASMIMGALALNGVIGSALFQPVKWHLIRKPEADIALLKNKNNNEIESNPVEVKYTTKWISNKKDSDATHPLSKSLQFMETEHIDKRRTNSICTAPLKKDMRNDVNSGTKKIRKGILTQIKELLDLELLLDFAFISIILANGLGYTSSQNFNILFPFFLQEGMGLTRPETAMCMSMLAGLDTIARLAIPFFTDHYRITSRMSYLTGCITLGLARTLMIYQSTYTGLIVTSAICGFVRSLIVLNKSLVVSEYFDGKDESKLPAALGLDMVMKGFVVITVGQFLGWIRDYSQSYAVCIHAQNSLLVLVVIMWAPELIYKKYFRTKR